ncbi:MAG: transposase, partial [Deltaproteobacteria bacterium]|nr:transposase [Deltaproteobacteria bacterium]
MSERKRITYSPAFKVEAVRRYLEGGRGYRQICEELGIKDKKTLRQWVAKVNNGESLEDGRGKSDSPLKGRPRTKFESL